MIVRYYELLRKEWVFYSGVYDFDQELELVIISLDTIKMLDASLKSLSF